MTQRDNMTPTEREDYLAYHRTIKRIRRANETPEQLEERRAKSRAYYYANRERILRERREKRANETPEEREKRLAHYRKYYGSQKATT